VSVATAQNFVFGLRAFLRFCFLEGLIGTDLSKAALPVTGRRRFVLLRAVADADVQAMRGAGDHRKPLGPHPDEGPGDLGGLRTNARGCGE
jgi:integrase/recombinase XerD